MFVFRPDTLARGFHSQHGSLAAFLRSHGNAACVIKGKHQAGKENKHE